MTLQQIRQWIAIMHHRRKSKPIETYQLLDSEGNALLDSEGNRLTVRG